MLPLPVVVVVATGRNSRSEGGRDREVELPCGDGDRVINLTLEELAKKKEKTRKKTLYGKFRNGQKLLVTLYHKLLEESWDQQASVDRVLVHFSASKGSSHSSSPICRSFFKARLIDKVCVRV